MLLNASPNAHSILMHNLEAIDKNPNRLMNKIRGDYDIDDAMIQAINIKIKESFLQWSSGTAPCSHASVEMYLASSLPDELNRYISYVRRYLVRHVNDYDWAHDNSL